MIVLAGGDLVLPDRIVTGGALVLDGLRYRRCVRGTSPTASEIEKDRRVGPRFI